MPTAFERWLLETFTREGPFTLFLVLFEEAPHTIVPIASSYLHVMGTELSWDELATLLGGSGMDWHSVAVFAAKDKAGGPLPDAEARHRLASLQQAVIRDRLTVHKGELFDRQGRRLDLQELPPQ
jgi:hypothetical protein